MKIKSLIALFAILILAAISPASASTPQIPTFELMAGRDPSSVAPFIRYTRNVDYPNGISLRRILERPLDRIDGQSIHFGAPGEKTTVLLKVRNAGLTQGSWILTTGRGTLNHFRLYESSGDQLKLLVDGTNPQSVRQNLKTYQAFSTELVLDTGQEKLIVIEFLSQNSTYLPLKINTYGTFFKERRANIAMVSGVVFGALILLLLNFLFFSITGHREFIWLAVAEAFFALNTVHAEGYITIFFLPDNPLLGMVIEDVFKCGFAAAMAQFGRSFVKTHVNFPKNDIALKLLMLCAVVIICLQVGLPIYPPEIRSALHISSWLVAIAVALYLPFIGFAAMRQLGYQLWPLFLGWASLAIFVTYAAIASMGVFAWLPINWHLAGPVGLFESIMVTVALGFNLKKIQHDKLAADRNFAASLSERLKISEQAARLAEEKAFALETVNSQNALLHASGHDSRQVILALNSAIDVLKRQDNRGMNEELTDMLQSSADYLNEIISATISGANIAGSNTDFLALSSFKGHTLVEPLLMMFKSAFADKGLTLAVGSIDDFTIISDKPVLMRALANLLSNSYKFTRSGGTLIDLSLDETQAVITIRDTGIGMPANIMNALNGGSITRLRANEHGEGTGSGFQSARRLVEILSGTLKIVSSTPKGSVVKIILPCAFRECTPVSADQLQVDLAQLQILDFDNRPLFDAVLQSATVPKSRIVAMTYDDTTITRGRLDDLVGTMIIKPPCREIATHPVFLVASEQV